MVILLVVVGLCLGSFVNAFVWRVHKQENPDKGNPNKKDLSIISGRSMCSSCYHALATKDLIPVFSWLWLRGKCRYCHKPIPDTPVSELLTPILFILSYIYWPYVLLGPKAWAVFVAWLVVLVMGVALTLYDAKWMLLPNRMVAQLTLVTAIYIFLKSIYLNEPSIILQSLFGAGLLAGLFWLLFQVSSGKWIGGGDVKMAVALGLLAGSPALAYLVIALASTLGTLYGLPVLIKKRSKTGLKIPFGPFLLLSTFLVVLFGQRVIDWYLSYYLF